MVDENRKIELENYLNKMKIKYRIVIENVANAIKNQYDFQTVKKPIEKLSDFDYSKYHTLNEINDWIDQLAEQYTKYVSVLNVTQSYEKRNLKAIKISIPSSTTKKAMWFDGGIHA